MSMQQSDTVFRLPPYSYIHVLDVTTNITRVEIGPQTFIKQDNEKVVEGPNQMITIPPRHYITVHNPVLRSNDDNTIVFEHVGEQKQVKLRHGEQEIRLSQEPFPLYPGEVIVDGTNAVKPLTVVPADTALRLKAVLDFTDANGKDIVAGDEWLFKGPSTYTPQVEVAVEDKVVATVIAPNQALVLRARKDLVDHKNNKRVTGEQWLVSEAGAYLPGVFEDVVDRVLACVLTDTRALHLKALRTFKDVYGINRKNGDEWLITNKNAESHIPDVYESIQAEIQITTLSDREYCVICDPCDDTTGRPQLGAKKLVTGPASFFLQPGESLENGIQDFYVLEEDEGLILKAQQAFDDQVLDDGEKTLIPRTPGDRWMIRGPAEYVPRVEVEVVEKRKAIPLDDNEGVYVRNIQTGKIRTMIGQTYMLNENEQLWDKELGAEVEALLAKSEDGVKGPHLSKSRTNDTKQKQRVKSRVVTFRVPHNGAVQMYDYTAKKARVVFGPELVMLGPDEQFTKLSLSGGKPKQPHQIKSLCLLLGPDFCTDIITIETADHARLSLQLSYNWQFKIDRNSQEAASRLFSVSDFVGDLCKAVASRIRGAVAGVQFDDFHKNSAKIIRTSVFGVADGKVRDSFVFPANGLEITSIDIQNVEPVDQRTRDALQKSVQLAIEITTNSQEATAKHEAQRLEQEAKGGLERQRISDEAKAELARKELLVLQANSSAVESTGQAKAEAQSRAEASKIEGEAAVDQATLKARAMQIEAEAELERLQQARRAELEYVKAQNALEVEMLSKKAEIEKARFASMVDAIGQETLRSIAVSGPETQAKLLGSLGIKSTLITDGKSPINLFQTAAGLLGTNVPDITESLDSAHNDSTAA